MQPTAVDFRELRTLIEGFGRKRVACVFRNQLGFIQSIYVQVTKSQSFVEFDYFVSQCVRSRYATGLALDYNLLLDHVLAGFAPGEVVLIPYEASVAGEGLVARLLPQARPAGRRRRARAAAGRQLQRLADAAGALARQPGRSAADGGPGADRDGRGYSSSRRWGRGRAPRSSPAPRSAGCAAPS